MGAFGKSRAANVEVNFGDKPIVQGAVDSKTVIPLWNDESKCANRSGMTAFGAPREIDQNVVDHHVFNLMDVSRPPTLNFKNIP